MGTSEKYKTEKQIIMANKNIEKKESAFEGIIRRYLELAAEQDALFAASFAKPNKSISECCKYIKQEAQKMKDGNVAIIEDSTVYGWAKHYYDEDDIKIEIAPPVKVASSRPTPTTTVKTVPTEPAKPKAGDQLSLFDFI